MTTTAPGPGTPAARTWRRPHPAWGVAAVAFVALVGAAGFRATPGVLLVPLAEDGFDRSTV